MFQHSHHDLQQWVDKHNTPEEVAWALRLTRACINSITRSLIVEERNQEELSLHRERLTLLRTKALLLDISEEP